MKLSAKVCTSLIVLLAMLPQNLLCDCVPFLKVFPKKYIGTEASIIITAGNGVEKVLYSLNEDYPVYLLSSQGDSIPLHVKELNDTRYNIVGVVLAPDKNLKEGEEYTLKIRNISDSLKENFWWVSFLPGNPELEIFHEWTAVESSKAKAPEWVELPEDAYREVEEMPYGDFTVSPQDFYIDTPFRVRYSGDVIMRASVLNKNSGEEHIFFRHLSITPKPDIDMRELAGIFAFGTHPFCSNEVYVWHDKEYLIAIDLIDAYGNITPWKGERLKGMVKLVKKGDSSD